MFLKYFRNKRNLEDRARLLYRAVVEQARQPVFYTDYLVADSLDGRFDMIALHMFLILHRLNAEGKEGRRLGQALLDTMFADMDSSLREIGVGDLSVGKRVKVMAEALFGRIRAYDSALQDRGTALPDAIRRNVYRGDDSAVGRSQALALYSRGVEAHLAGQDGLAILAGNADFGPVMRPDDTVVDDV